MWKTSLVSVHHMEWEPCPFLDSTPVASYTGIIELKIQKCTFVINFVW